MVASQEEIKKLGGDFLYAFIQEQNLTRANFGKYLEIIAAKRSAQIAYLSGLAAQFSGKQQDNYNNMKSWIREGCAEYYKPLRDPNTGKMREASPELVLYWLSQGYPVGGKNWKQGVFGCSVGSLYTSTESNNILQDYGCKLNSSTGVLTTSTGQRLQGSPNFYGGELIGRNYIANNGDVAFTANYAKGSYNLASAADSEGIIGDAGGATGAGWAGTVLNCIQIIAQMIPVVVNGIRSIKQLQEASALSGVNPLQVAPDQTKDGWAETQSSGSSTGLLIGGGLLLGGLALMKTDKKDKRK